MSADKLNPFIQRQPSLARITGQSVAAALADIPLEPRQGFDWLARAIQGVLLMTLPPDPIGCEQVSGMEPIELTRTAMRDTARHAKADIETAYAAIVRNRDMISRDEALDAERALERVLGSIAPLVEMKPSPPRENDTRRFEMNVERAYFLAPLFEMAFDDNATVNEWPDALSGHWSEFYRRIVRLTFDENVRNVRDVLKKARKMQLRFGPVEFSAGIIPEYPL